jgi:Na+-transporting methylmalonyl-CoA/oxaloacetate decarboxylase gamma subunit
MKGKWLAFLSVLAFAVCAVGLVVTAADKQEVPAEVVIASKLWPQLTKGPVNLSHKKHAEEYKIACSECHHKYENGKNVWKEGDHVQKCQECHNEPTIQMEKKLPPDQQKLNLKLAFHNNCQECHKKFKKDHPESKVPTACAGCHPKGGKDEG